MATVSVTPSALQAAAASLQAGCLELAALDSSVSAASAASLGESTSSTSSSRQDSHHHVAGASSDLSEVDDEAPPKPEPRRAALPDRAASKQPISRTQSAPTLGASSRRKVARPARALRSEDVNAEAEDDLPDALDVSLAGRIVPQSRPRKKRKVEQEVDPQLTLPCICLALYKTCYWPAKVFTFESSRDKPYRAQFASDADGTSVWLKRSEFVTPYENPEEYKTVPLGQLVTTHEVSVAGLDEALASLVPRLRSIVAGRWPAAKKLHKMFMRDPARRDGMVKQVNYYTSEARALQIATFAQTFVQAGRHQPDALDGLSPNACQLYARAVLAPMLVELLEVEDEEALVEDDVEAVKRAHNAARQRLRESGEEWTRIALSQRNMALSVAS